MPTLPNDFSSLTNRYRKAIIYVYQKNNIAEGMHEAGYTDKNIRQLKYYYLKMMKRPDAQDYLKYIKSNPEVIPEELKYLNSTKIKSIYKPDTLIIPAKLTEANQNFLEQYFLTGDKFKAMKLSFPEQEYDESTKGIALRKASQILANQSSIEYMNLLNERSLQEIFLSKSKIIKEVYELAKDCKDQKSRFAAVKAYELLARMTGLLSDNKSVNVNDGGKIEINYIVPDKIDTTLHHDIDQFLKENQTNTFTDVEWEQFIKDDTKNNEND